MSLLQACNKLIDVPDVRYVWTNVFDERRISAEKGQSQKSLSLLVGHAGFKPATLGL